MKYFLGTFLCLLLLGCETKEYDEYGSARFVDTSSQSTFGSNLDFDGINSVTSVTDTTAIINWIEIDGAVEYYIYDVTDGLFDLIERVDAPENAYAALRLQSGKEYSFLVRVRDSDAQLDTNEKSITVTTQATPDAPYYLVPTTIGDHPTLDHDVRSEPSLLILGVRPGDTVTVHTDSSCLAATEVGRVTLAGLNSEDYLENINNIQSFVTLQTDPLTVFTSYNFYSKVTNINGVESACSTASAEYEYSQCPEGYSLVELDGVDDFVTRDFCVMKFEARPWRDAGDTGSHDSSDSYDNDGCYETNCTTSNWSTTTYKPGSVGDYGPWRMLDMDTAKTECRSLGDGYDLINIYEWMTIARDIEAQAVNWSNMTIGVGECLFRGNNGIDDVCGYDYDGVDLRDEATRSADADALRALHILGNGFEIWDFAGNVAEWVDFSDSNTFGDEPLLGPEDCDDTWEEYGSDLICDKENDGYSDLDEDFYAAGNPGAITATDYNSNYGLGMFEGGTGGATLKGGSYRNGVHTGIFSNSFNQTEKSTFEDIGFRCVYRP